MMGHLTSRFCALDAKVMNQELRDKLNDAQRLDALRHTNLMDSAPDEAFDKLTRLAARILKCPVALVSLVDDRRQFFKSCVGLDEPWRSRRETPLSHSFCQYVVASETPLIVNDARQDAVLCGNHAVDELGVVAYVGIPIRASDGLVLGSFCVIDNCPRIWTDEQIEILTELTSSVMTEIELRRAVNEAEAHANEMVASVSRTHAMVEAALDCIITMDATGMILEFNPAAERTFGYRAVDVVGRQMADLIVPPDLRDAHWAGVQRFLKTGVASVVGKRIEVTAMHADGTEFPVELALTMLEESEPLFTAYLRDITERQQSARSIERSTAMLEAVQQAQRQFIAEGDARPTFEYLLQKLLGLTDSEYGFISEVRYRLDGQPYMKAYAISNIAWDEKSRAYYEQKDEGGLEFHNLDTLFGAVITTGQPVLANDAQQDPRHGGVPDGHPVMKSFLGLPFFHGEEMVGLVGIANRVGGYDPDLCDYLTPFLTTCASLIAGFRVRRQRRLMQEELRLTTQRLSLATEAAHVGIWEFDLTSGTVHWDAQFNRTFGIKSDARSGRYSHLKAAVISEDRQALREAFLTAVSGKGDFQSEFCVRRSDGEVRVVEAKARVQRDPGGKAIRMTGVSFDITERKRAEEALRVERDFMAAILDTVGALVLVLDRSGKIVRFNRACEEIMGYSSEEVIGKPLWEVPFYPVAESRFARQFWNDLSDNWAPDSYENYWETRYGDRRLIAWTNTVLRDPNGQITHIITCGMDITEQRADQAALARARENEVEIGSRIQQTLLIKNPASSVCGFGVGALTQASQRIDGDYFEFFSYDDNCFDFLIGDVMGKGVPAALLAAASKSHFQRAIRRLLLDLKEYNRLPRPEEILSAVHATMTRELVGLDSFITLCYARFDRRHRRMVLIDCGHTRTIHYHAAVDSCTLLQGENLPLGVRDDEQYTALTVPLEPDDVLFFYSDGVTEARNTAGEFFGEERLVQAVHTGRFLMPEELVEHVNDSVRTFMQQEQLADDLTCVAFRVNADMPRPPTDRGVREFVGSLDELEAMRNFIQGCCQVMTPKPLDEEIVHLLVLATNEAVTNIVNHAYDGRTDQYIQIVVEFSSDNVMLQLHDWGKQFDPTAIPDPDFEGNREHGFGMYIISHCVDDVSYWRDDLGRNCLKLTRKIRSEDAPEQTGLGTE
jgi:phosphoserine phosphatase RsbU/P